MNTADGLAIEIPVAGLRRQVLFPLDWVQILKHGLFAYTRRERQVWRATMGGRLSLAQSHGRQCHYSHPPSIRPILCTRPFQLREDGEGTRAVCQMPASCLPAAHRLSAKWPQKSKNLLRKEFRLPSPLHFEKAALSCVLRCPARNVTICRGSESTTARHCEAPASLCSRQPMMALFQLSPSTKIPAALPLYRPSPDEPACASTAGGH